jgi:uncharacterized protein YdiU (UPF0061 family)
VKHVYLAQLRDPDEDTHDTANPPSEKVSSNGGGKAVRDLDSYLDEVRQIAETDFAAYFDAEYNDVKRRKLGLHSFHAHPQPPLPEKTAAAPVETIATAAAYTATNEMNDAEEPQLTCDEQLWLDLETLMAASNCDFTILFRELGAAAELLVSTTTLGSAAKPTSSKEATRIVPAGMMGVGLFPNIDYAVSQVAEASDSEDDKLVSKEEEESKEGGAEAADTEVLVERALQLLREAFYEPDKVRGIRQRDFLLRYGTVAAYTAVLSARKQIIPSASAATASDPALRGEWLAWLRRYGHRLREDTRSGKLSSKQRRQMQDHANPRYVLRYSPSLGSAQHYLVSDLSCGLCCCAEIGWPRWHTKSKSRFLFGCCNWANAHLLCLCEQGREWRLFSVRGADRAVGAPLRQHTSPPHYLGYTQCCDPRS